MHSLTAAKIGRADADMKHNQKDKKEDFTMSSRDDTYVCIHAEAFCQSSG